MTLIPPKHRPNDIAAFEKRGGSFKMVPGPAWYAILGGRRARGSTKAEAAEKLLKEVDTPKR